MASCDVLQLRSVDGVPVLFSGDQPVARTLDQLLGAWSEFAGQASNEEICWLGKVAVVLASGLPQWPSRYAISKYIDYLGPSLSRELSVAFFEGQAAAFDHLRDIHVAGTSVADVRVPLAEWVVDEAPAVP